MLKLNEIKLDSIKKNSDDFSFISVFFELVGNKEFKKAEIDTLYKNIDSKTTSFWRSLSAVAENLGSEFYENILNFIDNIDNVDLCKVRSLQSIIDSLGIKYTVFNDIQTMPLDIIKAMDIFSIKREYLLDNTKINHVFIDNQMSACMCDYSPISASLLSACTRINNERDIYLANDSNLSNFYSCDVHYQTFLSDDAFNDYQLSVYHSILKSKIYQSYNNKLQTPVYEGLSDVILLSDFELVNDKQQTITNYKLLNRIPLTFNVEEEVDNLENNTTTISDYNSIQYGALSIEIERRKEQYKADELKTRYKYYREKELQEYTNFIENEYNFISLGANYVNNSKYDLDSKYIQIYQTDKTETSKYKLFSRQPSRTVPGEYYIKVNDDMIVSVASQLVQITNAIRDIREQVKIQSQKSFMYGTKLFLNYVIHEYVRNNVVQSLSSAGYLVDYTYTVDDVDVDTIEYYDTTDYNNISSENDYIISADNTNPKYWKEKNSSTVIGAIDTTGLYTQLPLIKVNNGSFGNQDLSTLYIDILNNKFSTYEYDISTQIDAMNEFLYTLFDIGAENTFVVDDTVQTYDSKILSNDYEDIRLFAYNYILSVDKYFKLISSDIPNTLNQNCVTLADQLSAYKDYVNYGSQSVALLNASHGSLVNDGITMLSGILFDSNDIKNYIPLSATSRELTYKYQMKVNAKYDQFQNALATDSYIKYKALKDAETTLSTSSESYYNKISVTYDNLMAFAEISSYVNNDLVQSDKALSTQLNDISLSIPALISSDSARRTKAYTAIRDLSSQIKRAGELSSQIELNIILETLSAQYEEAIKIKQNEYDDIIQTDLYKYRQEIFYKYTNTASSDIPYYYLNNDVHPSYALHPYIQNYIEKTTESYPIDSINNIDGNDMCELISSKIADLVDSDGYTINVYKNPVNSNTDYISRYEYDQTSQGYDTAVVESYDGFGYPSAIYDLVNNAKYKYIDENNNEQEATFIEAVSGVTAYSTKQKQYITYDACNPWYSHLDLSQTERERIAIQLSVLKDDIKDIVYGIGTSYGYDIYKYGMDVFKNTYCLIKQHNYNDSDSEGNAIDDEIELKNATGTIWMRYKDHPIAFPLYVLRRNDTSVYIKTGELYAIDVNCSQILDNESSNEEYKKLKLKNLKMIHKYDYDPFNEESYSATLTSHYKTMSYSDFTFTDDKFLMVLNGDLGIDGISASYPIIVKTNKTYNSNDDIYSMHHQQIDLTNQTIAMIDAKTVSGSLSDWTFETYFYDNTLVGEIYSKISCGNIEGYKVSDIYIRGAYYEFGSKTQLMSLQPILVDSVSSLNSYVENVCVAANKYDVKVAYIIDKPSELYNYIDQKANFSFMESLYNEQYYDYAVQTKDFTIGEKKFIYNSQHPCVKYTDIGFFGLNQTSNDFGGTYLGKYELDERGVYNFQMITNSKSGTPINFRQVIPCRLHEKYNTDGNYKLVETPGGFKFYEADLLNMHIFEPRTGNNETTSDLKDYSILSSNESIYDAFEIQKLLDGRSPYLKIDEEYHKFIQDAFRQIAPNRYEETLQDINHPCFYLCNYDKYKSVSQCDRKIPDIFYYPYGYTNVGDDNCMFKFSSSTSMPYISASWYGYTVNGEKRIQLDFNSLYNKSTNDKLKVNILNNLNLFLNLEKAGDAGYLDIYNDPLNNGFVNTMCARLYIKNMSDTKPKFMLSVCNIISSEYTHFITDKYYAKDNPETLLSGMYIVTEGSINEYIINEYVK